MAPESEPDYSFLDRVHTETAKEWQRACAATPRRRRNTDPDAYSDCARIVFPDAEGMRHAALVVAGWAADLPDPNAAALEVLEALGIPQIMREGGDGRVMREEKPSRRAPRDADLAELEALGTRRFLAEADRQRGRRGRPKGVR